MLVIIGWGSYWLGSITAPYRELRRQEETIDPGSIAVGYILPKADICWGSLVGAGVDSGYLIGMDVS